MNHCVLFFDEPVNAVEEGPEIIDLYKRVYDLITAAWSNGTAVIAIPNIPLKGLRWLKALLREYANADNLDLDVLVCTKLVEGQPVETQRWALGWDDGHQIFIHLFTAEFFSEVEDPRTVFEQDLLPQLLPSSATA